MWRVIVATLTPKEPGHAPLPPAIVTFDSEGRSPVADKADAAVAAITEGGHHLLGSDIPRNLTRGLKASATSLSSLSSDSLSKSSADEQPAPASTIDNHSIKSPLEDTTGSVSGGLEAEVLSTKEAHRLIFDDDEGELSDSIGDEKAGSGFRLGEKRCRKSSRTRQNKCEEDTSKVAEKCGDDDGEGYDTNSQDDQDGYF